MMSIVHMWIRDTDDISIAAWSVVLAYRRLIASLSWLGVPRLSGVELSKLVRETIS